MIGFGIIGCGAIHRTHIDAIHQAGGVVTACCDIDETRGYQTATAESCSYYHNYLDLLADETVDVVVILTPHYLHKEMSLQALAHQKHVLCEKPMATTIKDAEEVMAAAAASDKIYRVCYQNRFNPSYIAMEQLFSQNLGELRGVKAEVSWNREADYYAGSSWKGTWQKEGGGVLINQAIHTIDAVCRFAGTPRKVKGKIMTSLLDGVIEVEDAALGVGLIGDETKFVLYASNDYSSDPTPVITFDFVGGEVVLTSKELRFKGHKIPVEIYGNSQAAKDYWGVGHQKFYQTFLAALEGVVNKETALLAGADAFDSLQVVCGIYESSKKNDWVTLRAPVKQK